MAKKERDVIAPGAGSSLGDLLRARGLQASATPAPTTPAAPAAKALAPGEPDLSGKLVLRRSKKGRGGKTATLVQGVGGGPVALEALAKKLRKALGCGTSVDGDEVVVQGEQGDRLEALLTSWGAKRIVRG